MIVRNWWLCAVVLGAWALGVPAAGLAGPAPGKRPNIIFIQTDSQDGRVLGSTGHPAMRRATPNLDALAARGVLFRNAYTNNPICCPSRASMWSGRWTHHCEGWNNYKGLEPDEPTFRTCLEKAGYRVQTFGKTDYVSGQHSLRARISAWTRSANIARPQYNPGLPRIVAAKDGRVHAQDWKLVDQSIEWLHKSAGQGPFLLYLGLGIPHPAYVTSPEYLARIDEAGVKIPPPDEEEHPVMRYQRATKNWAHGFSDDVVRSVRRTYFAMIAETDAMVGLLLEALRREGLADSTYVIFTSDHGENAMEHQQWFKMNLYESSARVPLVIAGPGVGRGVRLDQPASLVDIFPTLMDMAGIPLPQKLDGGSLVPELRGEKSKRPNWVLSEYHDTTCNTGAFMIRQGHWKLIVYPGYPSQLFDLKNDPDEVRNLAADARDFSFQMETLLLGIVDYRAVDAKVKAYDRESFRQWRSEAKAAGNYAQVMARVFSGWDGLKPQQIAPWTDKDEAQVRRWLGEINK